MNSAELKSRTKQYAIDIIRFVDSVPPKRTFEFEEDNESAQHHLLVQITDQHPEHDQEPISFSKSLSLKKKLENV